SNTPTKQREPRGFGLRQPSAAFDLLTFDQSGKGLPHSKTLPRMAKPDLLAPCQKAQYSGCERQRKNRWFWNNNRQRCAAKNSYCETLKVIQIILPRRSQRT